MKPITPEEVVETRSKAIPDDVIAAFNEEITRTYNGRSAIVPQDRVVEKIHDRMPNTPRQEIFDNHWLDVEHVFSAAGWDVTYVKPAYNEDFKAYFTFARKEG